MVYIFIYGASVLYVCETSEEDEAIPREEEPPEEEAQKGAGRPAEEDKATKESEAPADGENLFPHEDDLFANEEDGPGTLLGDLLLVQKEFPEELLKDLFQDERVPRGGESTRCGLDDA